METGLLALSVPKVLHFPLQVQLCVVLTISFFELIRDLFLVSLVLQIHSHFLEFMLMPKRQALLGLTVSLRQNCSRYHALLHRIIMKRALSQVWHFAATSLFYPPL